MSNQGSISGIRPRGDTIATKNKVAKGSNSRFAFRLARLGPGWVLGATELCCGLRQPGVHVSVSESRLYFLRYDDISRIEAENPSIALHIYKLVSYLQSKANEREIEQLTMMKSIHNTVS